jgi:hypothetical protein
MAHQVIHTAADGKKYLVIHGHQADGLTHFNHLLEKLGSHLYNWILDFNLYFNRLRRALGFGYWSLAAYLKFKAKSAVKFVTEYEGTLASMARSQQADGVICGHIHRAEMKMIDGVQYLNCGDWVESCTALIEDFDGKIKLIHFHENDVLRAGRGPGSHDPGDGREGNGRGGGASNRRRHARRERATADAGILRIGDEDPVRQLPTLEFKYKNNRSVSNTATLLGVFGKLPKYFRILRQLDAIVRETQPDVIINFFEPMAAFYAITRRKRPPVVAIGHQFMFQHPGYVRAPQLWKQLLSMKLYTRLLGARATKLALSLYEAPDLPGKTNHRRPADFAETAFPARIKTQRRFRARLSAEPRLRRPNHRVEREKSADEAALFLRQAGRAGGISAFAVAHVSPARRREVFADDGRVPPRRLHRRV